MKILTIICALLVVTLSVMPCCLTDNCASEEMMTEQADSHEKDTDACSPFYSCSTCIGFTVSDFSVAPVTPLLSHSGHHFATYRQSFFTQFHHAIWQPPKLS
ncbi:DUF6660 family protein [Pontibacter pamirensis]|uniref:DUF6660 family protein n=1 Tax=Pontibacter pamirensis TaxID=2562824 RepID=UPI00293B8AE9|nr:DUF6660 family protein [Pontibacter pamirensis]